MASSRTRKRREPVSPFDHVPFYDPEIPNISSPFALLWWIAYKQKRLILTGAFFGIVSTIALAMMPGLLGHAVQSIADHDQASVNRWALMIIGLGVIQAGAGVMRHRRAISSWIVATARLKQILARKATELGADLPRLVTTGEVVSVNNNDVERMSRGFDNLPRLIGAVTAFIYVTILLISSSSTIGLFVVIAVPLASFSMTPIIGPLQARESEQRRRLGIASNLASDTVAGLRVLRGIGGEQAFVERFKVASQEVRAAAVLTAKSRSLLQALQIVLPGVIVLVVIYAGGNLVASGHMKVGELLSFYGYSAFLVLPIRVMLETAQRTTSAVVSARRVIHLLAVTTVTQWGKNESPDLQAPLVDRASGLIIYPRQLVVVVSDSPLVSDDLSDRLGGYSKADEVTIGSLPLSTFTRSAVRNAIFVQEKDPAILSGTIGSIFHVKNSGKISIAEAIEASSAQDIMDSLDGEGLSAEVVERGRTLSGGQRQRLALARTLFVDAPITILDDPTSAVDAHTESRIAIRLSQMRRGKTTVIFSNSPLILDTADRVVLLIDGKFHSEGTHQHLLHSSNEYRQLVMRGV